jgi:hypothetical protein
MGKRPLDYRSGRARWKGQFPPRIYWIPNAMLRSLETEIPPPYA